MGSLPNIYFGVCWASWGGSGKKRVPLPRDSPNKIPPNCSGTSCPQKRFGSMQVTLRTRTRRTTSWLAWLNRDQRFNTWRAHGGTDAARCVSAQDLGGGVVYTGLLSTGMVPANKQSCQHLIGSSLEIMALHKAYSFIT